MSQIIPLSEASAENMSGGKAAALGKLLRTGFQVPTGFVVPPSNVEITDKLKTDILQAFEALSSKYVAVRSSALQEDGKDATWAGQLETYLNVDRDSLLAHIELCMQSAQTDRARAYAEQKNVASGGVAVLVQAMVDSDVSGVAFSAHPVTLSREQMVIEAGLGLGEAVVSGEITPDTYILDATTGVVIESHISDQAKQLVRTCAGRTEWQAIDPVAHDAKLNVYQLGELHVAIKNLAALVGFPVDVEWAFVKNKLYILQSRPITTLE